ncbi:MAG: TatD family hydrolase [Verrucomicrobiales bacterium]|nr:TatD family hydrolase [Verrucomicrobiales bacterium]
MLIDTHCHLASPRFRDEIPQIVEAAREAGVERIVTIACDLEDSPVNIDLAAEFDGVYATVGIHPCYVHEIESEDWVAELRTLAAAPKVVAIGEIGLDYFHAPPEGFDETGWKKLQHEIFRTQLDLAVELDLPVVIHQRESNEDIMAVLETFAGSSLRAVLHCYTGSLEQAERAFELGHLVSFTGIVTFPKATDVQQVAAAVPSGRFMVETDSPYLAPVPNRGKRCQPADTLHTARHLADLRNVTFEKLAQETTDSARSFFGITD